MNKPLTINGINIGITPEGLYCLDDVYQAILEEMKGRSTLAGREQFRPQYFLQSDFAKDMAKAITERKTKNLAYIVIAKPAGGIYACKEMLLDYCRWYSASFLLNVLKLSKSIDGDDRYELIKQPFFGIFDKINGDQDQPFNHSNNPEEEIAFNLSEVIQHCHDNLINLPVRRDIVRLLKRNKNYQGNLIVRSRLSGETIRCFVLKRA